MRSGPTTTPSSPKCFSIKVSGASGITRLFIDYISDGGGIGWDDFTFYR